MAKRTKFCNLFLGKKHTEETKQKIGAKNSCQTGSRNSAFGKMWINNGVEKRMVAKRDYDSFISSGWRKGRSIRWASVRIEEYSEEKSKSCLWGRTWINNGVKSKIVTQKDLSESLSSGWIRGRLKRRRQSE